MNDLSDELIEFLEYVEHSDDKTAEKAKGELVKKVHKKVSEVKSDSRIEVEFMTLLERDREKIEEGKEEGLNLAKKVFKLDAKGNSIEDIARECKITQEEVKKILE